MSDIGTIGILGYGEVGQILAEDLSDATNHALRAFDLLFEEEESGPSRAVAANADVLACRTAADMAAGSDVIISVVTASEATRAAASVAARLDDGCYYLDLNSVSPATHRETEQTIEGSGGRFVEAALLGPIAHRRIESPILLGGPHAESFATEALSLGFSGARAFSPETGRASAVKMCRSVVIKGVEALLAESLAAARYYGVESEVLDSLGNLLPADDWNQKARYMISRSLLHGERRAAEMNEVAHTVSETGIEPLMSRATADRQLWASRFVAAVDADLPNMLDSLLEPQRTRREASDG